MFYIKNEFLKKNIGYISNLVLGEDVFWRFVYGDFGFL